MNNFAAFNSLINYALKSKNGLAFTVSAAAISLLCLAVFIVALARKPHRRGAAQILFLIFGSLIFIAAAIITALAVIITCNPFNSFKFVSDIILLLDRTLKTGAFGDLVVTIQFLGLLSVALSAAAAALSLAALIAVSVKSKRKAAKAAKPQDGEKGGQADERQEQSEQESEAAKDEQPYAAESGQAPEREQAAERWQEPKPEPESESAAAEQPAEDGSQPRQNGGDFDFGEITDGGDEAHSIVDEIDALVTGERQENESDVGEQLKRAIMEGYALTDAYADSAPEYDSAGFAESADGEYQSQEPQSFADIPDEAAISGGESQPQDEQSDSLNDEPEPESEADGEPEQNPYEEEIEDGQSADEPSYEDYAFYNDGDSDGQTAQAEEQPEQEEQPEPQPEQGKRQPSEQTLAPRPRVSSAAAAVPSDMFTHTRVRTIIRRPTARNADELIERAEANTAPAPAKPQTAAEPSVPSKPAASAAKKQTEKKTAKKTAKKPPQTNKPKPDPVTEVEAEENKLPITRKYIILNRRNAAAVFNEYLNGKKEQEKKEITDNLNTIIIK